MGREVENKGNRMNEIDLLVKLFKAVKLMRSLQQSPCLESERLKAETAVDKVIESIEEHRAALTQRTLFE